MASTLSIATSVCSSIVSPFTFPVPGSIGPQPVTRMKSPARQPCEYAPRVVGLDHLLRHAFLPGWISRATSASDDRPHRLEDAVPQGHELVREIDGGADVIRRK